MAVPGDGLIFAGDVARSTLSRWEKEGRVDRVAPGVYTAGGDPSAVVASSWRDIVARVIPAAVVVDRSAVTGGPRDGFLFLDSGPDGRRAPLELPGLTVVPRRGPGPIEGDIHHGSGIWYSSQARALADNTRPTRARGRRPAATLSDDELGDWVDHLAGSHGSERLMALRTAAERLAEQTSTTDSIARMSELVGVAVGTKDAPTRSRRLRARQAGLAYDHRRGERFSLLADHLGSVAPSPIGEPPGERGSLLSFYEAYFSNFIEGTELDLDDAADVVFRGVVLGSQPEDSHDVASTFQLVDGDARSQVPESASEFEELLVDRHRMLMVARPQARPGEFKTVGNRAGATTFVEPDLVRGTLREGWAHIANLADPFHRAVVTMFVVAEVHPFLDGNGRLARIMMNAELSAAGECRIIIPSVYRGEYLSSLSALSNNDRPAPLERVLGFAQRWTSQVNWTNRTTAEADLQATNAFVDSGEAVIEGIKLTLPAALPAHDQLQRAARQRSAPDWTLGLE